MPSLVGRRQGCHGNLEIQVFWQALERQGYNCNLGTRGRPSWKATGLQLRSGNSRFFGGRPSWKATGLQLQSGYSAGPVGRRQGYNCNLGTRVFCQHARQAQLEGDNGSRLLVQKLLSFGWKLLSLPLTFFGGRPNWKATGLQLQSGISSFFVAAGPVTTAIWELGIFWWQAQLEVDRAATVI